MMTQQRIEEGQGFGPASTATANPDAVATPEGLGEVLTRSACTECQRRKQKCDRQYPCEQCQRRRVPDACRYKENGMEKLNTLWRPSEDVTKKRNRRAAVGVDAGPPSTSTSFAMIGAMGYTEEHVLAVMNELDQGGGSRKAQSITSVPKKRQHMVRLEDSPAMARAVTMLPSRQLVDAMIQHFLKTINFYYYIVYPYDFLKEYNHWWRDYNRALPLPQEWTCLLIMVCSCSVQHANTTLTKRLRSELGQTPKALSEKYHNAAKELYGATPVRTMCEHPHLYTLQYLLHSCYWFKAEAMFEQCWDVLGSAVREAQKIRIHRESANRGRTDFDKEMRRRLWCTIDAWDWLISILLARPLLIDRVDCDAELPALNLESEYTTSPMLHMKIQAELVRKVWGRFGHPSNIASPKDVVDYKQILETWMAALPPAYRFENPDLAQEETFPWIELHRHYTHTVALSMALGPSRPYLAAPMSRDSPPGDLDARAEGVTYGLRLMGAVHCFFDYVWHRDTTFHFVPFCIFDTAALLCAAIRHDQDESLPRKREVYAAIDLALFTLRRLASATETARNGSHLLKSMASKLPNSSMELRYLGPTSHQQEQRGRKKARHTSSSTFQSINGSGSGTSAEKEAGPLPSPEDRRLFYLEHPARNYGGDSNVSLPYTISSTTGVVTVSGRPVVTANPQPVLAANSQHTGKLPSAAVPLPTASKPRRPPPISVLPNAEAPRPLDIDLPPEVAPPNPAATAPAPSVPVPPYVYPSVSGEPQPPPEAYASSSGSSLLPTYTASSSSSSSSSLGLETLYPVVYTTGSELNGPTQSATSAPHDAAQLAQLPQNAEEPGAERFGIITEAQLGDLANLWNWESLNLDLTLNPDGTLNGL